MHDRNSLLAFYDFPTEHWQHIRITNPIESTFTTLRHRTTRARNCLSRAKWPNVRLIVRGDSDFCRPAALRRFEQWGVHYIIGLQKNAALLRQVELAELALADAYAATGVKQRMIDTFGYAAGTWDRQRQVIALLEHDARGTNPRFVVTSLHGDWEPLYERLYCARGEAENRIKEAQLDLLGGASLAYTLMIHLRRLAPHGTELERACTATIRVKLLKIGAAIVRNSRPVRVLMASLSHHPLRQVFFAATQALAP